MIYPITTIAGEIQLTFHERTYTEREEDKNAVVLPHAQAGF